MKIRHRLSLQFALICGVLLLAIFSLIYFLSSHYIATSFYGQLQDRALITAQVYLEKDELAKRKFQEIQKKYLNSIPDEVSNIYDDANKAVFIDNTYYNWKLSLLSAVRKDRLLYFRVNDQPAVGIYYTDNQGNYVVIVTAPDVAGRRQLHTLLAILISTFALSLLLIFFAGQWFAFRALQPIANINRQVQRIRATNLHHRVRRARNKDEVDELAANFNELLAHLEAAFNTQRSFVSNASHELRTPLTTIIGEIEVTLQKSRQPEVYLETLHSVLDESVKLKSITDGLLQLTKTDFSLPGVAPYAIRLDELLIALQIEWAKEKPPGLVQLHFENLPEDSGPLSVMGNEALLELAFQNILKNAFKFSDYKPVTVTLRLEPQLHIEIRDQGIGIAPGDLKNIFLPLFRAPNAYAYDGYGIGLALSQKILELHSAKIEVESEPGVGSVFHIRFK
ncbi:Signal transduction histidine kinase [Chitinophaga costaii]|uniref:histidine kinase n=1 Tax=Chitinophaga costaii TaxID=1335309 RepID=A0A1C4CSY0_9BACT|nr:HAMP domain-containing sensor histidine kinase [Chitinophaga costaii]PUZ26965.1 sensor histidine kinase [Chitinophaga costaii]SCC22112.1 Signal transduction histidine kinase [Chitinophaga costaii]